MKRKIAAALLFAGLLLLLAGLTWYDRALMQLAPAAGQPDSVAPADAEGEKLARSCAYCHGRDGNPNSPLYPRLAGQTEAYLRQQMLAYSSGRRQNAVMSPLAQRYSAAQIDTLSRYFATRVPRKNRGLRRVEAIAARGEELVSRAACAGCHGRDLAGSGEYPRLAWQSDRYLYEQLKAFRDGERDSRDDLMKAPVAGLSDSELEAIAHYLATF